jgi:hypothetical protein
MALTLASSHPLTRTPRTRTSILLIGESQDVVGSDVVDDSDAESSDGDFDPTATEFGTFARVGFDLCDAIFDIDDCYPRGLPPDFLYPSVKGHVLYSTR